ncbi:hypothetical protein ACLOJK_012497 [Asimina triloba]
MAAGSAQDYLGSSKHRENAKSMFGRLACIEIELESPGTKLHAIALHYVMLWRQKNVTLGILFVTLAAWIVFDKSGYTLLSLVANVFLLEIAILFVWAKSAAILNRYFHT